MGCWRVVEEGVVAGVGSVVASAVSARRSVLVEVDGSGFVSAVRLLNGVVRSWDSRLLDERVRLVAGVAHDRWLANARPGDVDALRLVAERERRLDF